MHDREQKFQAALDKRSFDIAGYHDVDHVAGLGEKASDGMETVCKPTISAGMCFGL